MLLPKDVRIPVILMAAGMSTRMGRNKLLLPFNGQTVIAETCDRLLQSHVSRIIVVLGNDQDKIREALRGKNVEMVINTSYAQGMMSSLKAGMGYLGDDPFFMVALGDQPLVSVSAYNALIETSAYTYKKIIVPTYGRQRGNPIILSSDFIDELFKMDGDFGGREILKRYPEWVHEVPVINEGVLINMNTPDLYEHWVEVFESGKHI